MNQSRFKALKIVMQRAQINNCPIAPVKTTLYKDTVSGKKVFVNEFKNNGDRKVISFTVKISCFDENVNLIGTIKDYKYNDVNALSGEEFGQGKIIACPDQSINSLAIAVTHVELDDDYYWDASNGKIISHADSIVEEVEIEMAPMLDDMKDIAGEVERNVEAMSKLPVASAEPIVASAASVSSATPVKPVVATIIQNVQNEPVNNAVENVTAQVSEPVQDVVTPITLDEPIAPVAESVNEVVEAMTNVDAATEKVTPVAEPVTPAAEEVTPAAEAVSTKEIEPVTEESDPLKEAAAQLAAARVQAEMARNGGIKTEASATGESVQNQEADKAAVAETTEVVSDVVSQPKQENVEPEAEKKAPIEVELNFDNKSKKSKKPIPKAVKIIVGVALTAAFLFVAVVALTKYRNYSDYNRGTQFLTEGKYDYAITTFTRLGNYADSPTLLLEAKKGRANVLKESGDFATAIEEYKKIGGQEDKIVECYDGWVRSYIAESKYQEALDLINNPDLTFNKETVDFVRYNMGVKLYEEKYFEEAVAFFADIRGYENAEALMNDAYYELGIARLNAGDYEKALSAFGLISNYKDAAAQIKKVKYSMGKRAADNHRFEEAIECFEEVAGYEDADQRIIDCYYQYGVESLTAFDYEAAMASFKKIEGNESYEDLEDKYTEALYKFLLEDMKNGVTLETMDKLAELPKKYEDTANIVRTLNKYVDHVGEYEWMTSNDKEVNEKGGFEEHVIVTLAYNNGEVIFQVDGHPVDLKLFVYKSGTDSDTYTMLNTTTITRTFNDKIHTYKKIKKE